MVYQASYHRCIFEIDRTWKKIVFALLPFLGIIIMYALMLFFVKRAKIETKKLLIMSSFIIAIGVITMIPDQLLIAFGVSHSLGEQYDIHDWYNTIPRNILHLNGEKL